MFHSQSHGKPVQTLNLAGRFLSLPVVFCLFFCFLFLRRSVPERPQNVLKNVEGSGIQRGHPPNKVRGQYSMDSGTFFFERCQKPSGTYPNLWEVPKSVRISETKFRDIPQFHGGWGSLVTSVTPLGRKGAKRSLILCTPLCSSAQGVTPIGLPARSADMRLLKKSIRKQVVR